MTDMSKFKVAKSFKHLDPSQGLADGIAAGFSSIRYRGKQWSLSHGGKLYPFRRDDDGTPLSYVDLIILGISPGLSKVYFGAQSDWSEESSSGPLCASLKGDVPDPGVPEKQSPSCGICEHNEWITKPGGGRGKECQDHKRMAVLLMPTMTKKMLNGTALLEPVYLKIPPGSLKALKKYSDELQQQGIPFASVVTRVGFSPDRLFEMNFDAVQALSDAEAPLVLPLMQNNQTRAIMGSLPELRQMAPPPPAPEQVATGLMDAFGATNGGMPAQPKPRKPRVVTIEQEAAPQPAEAKTETPAEAILEEGGETPWQESDTDLDATVAKLMGDKMSKMLK
jgi:hypothetical protein